MTLNERMSLPLWKKIIIYTLSFIFFCLQIALIVISVISTNYLNGFKYFNLILQIISAFYVVYIIYKPMITAYKLTWSILILLFPLPFTILYTINSFSRRNNGRKRRRFREDAKIVWYDDDLKELESYNKEAANIVKVVQNNIFAPVNKNINVTFFKTIEEKFEDLLLETEKAKSFILIEYFIIAPGKLMDRLYPLLLKKGNDGVKIKILYDSIGSSRVINHKFIKKLSKIPNCEISNYEPVGMNLNPVINNRDHRKIYVIDGKIAYCGGDNLADEYINELKRYGHWRDNCAKYEGNIVKSFIYIFNQNWETSTKKSLLIDDYFSCNHNIKNDTYVMAFGDGPVLNGNSAYDFFSSLITSAHKRLYISTPYFILNDGMIRSIALKAKEGIDVKILMPKIPDKKTAFYMGRANYRSILEAGGKIYEYTPGFNHAKNIIVDNDLAFIGTINMDYRSLFLHYECGAFIVDNKINEEMGKDFNEALLKSEEITYDKWKKRPWYQKLLAFILNIFAPMF